MDEAKKLRKENKKLKKLLIEATDILTKYRKIVESAYAKKKPRKTARKKKKAAKPK